VPPSYGPVCSRENITVISSERRDPVKLCTNTKKSVQMQHQIFYVRLRQISHARAAYQTIGISHCSKTVTVKRFLFN